LARFGFIPIGVFSLRPDGADGSVLQMVNHGLVVAPIFLIIALLWERSGSEDLTRLGGLAMRAPVLAALFLIITLATLAMPGSANFIGEFYILIGVFQAKIVYAFVAIVGVALAAFYAIRLFQRTMHNRLAENADSREIALRDAAVLAPLVERKRQDPQFEVRMFVQISEHLMHGMALQGEDPVSTFRRTFASRWWPRAPMPEVFYEPRAVAAGIGHVHCHRLKLLQVDSP